MINEEVSSCPIPPVNSDPSLDEDAGLGGFATIMRSVTTLDKENLFIKCLCNIDVGSVSLICLQKLHDILCQVLLLFFLLL